jgi:hypothetical protein
MRTEIALIGLLLSAPPVVAQSIEIGGVEVRIGDTATAAMENLRRKLLGEFVVGRVHVVEQGGVLDTTSTWYVQKTEAERRIDVATVSVRDGLISALAKFYDIGDGTDVADVYSEAMTEVQRESHERCVTLPPPMNSDLIRTITTRCGLYDLVLDLPWKNKNGPGTSRMAIAVLVGPVRTRPR